MLEWVDGPNHRHLLARLGHVPPVAHHREAQHRQPTAFEELDAVQIMLEASA